MKRLFLLSILVIFTTAAQAQVQDPILTLPEGQIILNISATERREVDQDLLVATLAYQNTNVDARVLQNEINSAMQDALALIKKSKDIKHQTGTYQLYETTDSISKQKQWQGSQSVTLKSKNSEALLELVGKLQDLKLKMNNLSYVLSPETAVEIKDSLMEAALQQLQERARRAAKVLGKANFDLRDVSVRNDSVDHYQPEYAARSFMADGAMALGSMAAPVAASGEETISLTVSARAILKP